MQLLLLIRAGWWGRGAGAKGCIGATGVLQGSGLVPSQWYVMCGGVLGPGVAEEMVVVAKYLEDVELYEK